MIRVFIYGFLFGLIFNLIGFIFIVAIEDNEVVRRDEFEIKTIGFLIGIICNIVIIVLLSK